MMAVALLGLAAGMATGSADAGATSPRVCSVLEAAYTAATRSPGLVHPATVGPTLYPSGGLEHYVPAYRARMGLRPGEFEDLEKQQGKYAGPPFEPHCRWNGPAKDVPDGGKPMIVSFSNPIFSSGGGLALVEVSFKSRGWWGYGQNCIVRRTGSAWSAHCLQSWIS